MYITHYYPNNAPGLFRITEYSEEERNLIAKFLSLKDGSALFRFKDFDFYFQKRLKTEKWLYSSAKKLGIVPTEISPWYFVLGENRLMKEGFGSDTKTFKLDLESIKSSDITFTIGDSIAIYFSKQIETKVYDKDSIIDLYTNNYSEIDKIYKNLQLKHQYIEAQLWTKKYF